MKEVMVTVEYAGDNLSAYVEGAPVIATGKNLQDIEQNMQEAINVYLESCKELGIEPSESLQGELTLKFHIDAATFINYYSNIFTKAALSRITGINERQLWHYAAGVHKPRQRQLEKIQNGVFSLSQELQSFSLV
ncbi:MAG: antitoxin HicB [Prevotella sp.]|nr:antitoxin HicB [Prevotella sp.]